MEQGGLHGRRRTESVSLPFNAKSRQHVAATAKTRRRLSEVAQLLVLFRAFDAYAAGSRRRRVFRAVVTVSRSNRTLLDDIPAEAKGSKSVTEGWMSITLDASGDQPLPLFLRHLLPLAIDLLQPKKDARIANSRTSHSRQTYGMPNDIPPLRIRDSIDLTSHNTSTISHRLLKSDGSSPFVIARIAVTIPRYIQPNAAIYARCRNECGEV